MLPRPCLTCGRPTKGSRCSRCQGVLNRRRELMRPGASALRVGGSTRRWRRLRAAQLVREPICQVLGCDRPAVEVDHLVARVDGGTDDPDNLVSLCREDHHLRHAGVELRIQESAPLPVGGPPWIA